MHRQQSIEDTITTMEYNDTIDLKRRIETPEGDLQIPSDWSAIEQLKQQPMNPNYTRPISRFERLEQPYTLFQSLREKRMIRDAYGVEDAEDNDIAGFRSLAASEVKQQEDELVIDAAEAGVRSNVNPQIVTDFLNNPPNIMNEKTGLEKKSIENPMEEALQENLDLEMFHTDSALKMEDERQANCCASQ